MPDIDTLQKSFKSELDAYDTLASKASKTDDETKSMLVHLEAAEGYKSAIEAERKSISLKEWGGQSTGTPPVAPSTSRFDAAGKSEVVIGAGRKLLDEGPNAGLNSKQMATISTKDYSDAFRTYLRKDVRGLAGTELKTLQEGQDDQGGFLVPLDVLNRIISREPTPTRVGGRVTRFTTGRDKVSIPVVNYAGAADDPNAQLYTTGMRTIWTGEVPASSTVERVVQPVFSQVSVPIYTAMMSMPLTNDLIEDAMFPLVNWVSNKFAETVDLFQEASAINGTGVGQPAGILLNPGAVKQPAVVATGSPTLTADGLQTVAWSLPEQYDDNSAWVMNKTSSGQAIAKLKDANGRYLWQNFDEQLAVGLGGGNGGESRRVLLGYPVLFTGFMPGQGANNYWGIFGDLTGYYQVNRVGFSVQVLKELYAETNQILLLGRLRFGGMTAEPWKMLIAQNA